MAIQEQLNEGCKCSRTFGREKDCYTRQHVGGVVTCRLLELDVLESVVSRLSAVQVFNQVLAQLYALQWCYDFDGTQT